jgi:hypothetical protein
MGGGIQCVGGLCDEHTNCPVAVDLYRQTEACKEIQDWVNYREHKKAYYRHLEAAAIPRSGKGPGPVEPATMNVGGFSQVRKGSKGVSPIKGHSHVAKGEDS